MLQDGLIIYLENVIDAQVVDSGASFHATPDKKHFHDYVQGDFGKVISVMIKSVKLLEWTNLL